MSDVLDNDRGPTPLWVVPLAIIAVVAVVVALAWQWSSGEPTSGRGPVVASPSPSPVPTLPAPVKAGNACGGEIEQPLIDVTALPVNTGLRILVGDRDLRLVEVDAGTARVLSTRTDKRSFVALHADGNRILTLLQQPCSAAGFGKGEVGAVDAGTGAVVSLGRGDDILPGHPTTVVQFDADGAARLRELGSTATTKLQPGWRPYARTRDGYLASIQQNGFDSGVPPLVGIGDPDKATLTRSFGGGNVVAATPERLYWTAGECPGPRCLLTWTTVEGTNTAQAVDGYACCGAVSPDGNKLAFRKSRLTGRFGEHPGPPQDVAILDTTTGGAPLQVLKGLTLGAKSGLTLTWSPDSQWLVIGADLGTGPAVLIWRKGMDTAAEIRMPPTGGGTTGPPALLVLPR